MTPNVLKSWAKRRFDALPYRTQKILYNALKKPSYTGLWLVPDTFTGTRFNLEAQKLIHWRETRARRWDAVNGDADQALSIPTQDGYLLTDLSDYAPLSVAVDRARAMLEKIDLDAKKTTAIKPFLLTSLIPQDAPAAQPIFDLACDPVFIDPISKYLGMVPILQYAFIFYSPSDASFEPGRSQQYHMDGEDYRQVKVFIFLDDVDEQTGPLTIVPAAQSRQIFDTLRARRLVVRRNTKLDDDVIYSAVDGVRSIPMVGPKGTVAFVDTCACYHFGSRPGRKPRKVLLLHYLTPFAREMPAWGRKPQDVQQSAREEPKQRRLRQLVLGLSHLSDAKNRALRAGTALDL